MTGIGGNVHRYSPLSGFRVFGVNTKNSNPKFTGESQTFHYTFLFGAYDGLPFLKTLEQFQVFLVPAFPFTPAMDKNGLRFLRSLPRIGRFPENPVSLSLPLQKNSIYIPDSEQIRLPASSRTFSPPIFLLIFF